MVFGKNEKLEQRFYNFRGPGGPVRIYLPTPRQLVSRPYNNIITSTRALVRIVHTHAHAPSTSIFSLLFFIYRTPSPPAPVYRNFVNIRSPSRRHVVFLHIYLFFFFLIGGFDHIFLSGLFVPRAVVVRANSLEAIEAPPILAKFDDDGRSRISVDHLGDLGTRTFVYMHMYIMYIHMYIYICIYVCILMYRYIQSTLHRGIALEG